MRMIKSEFEFPRVILEILVDGVPIDNLGKVVQVGSSNISIVNVVSMLPDIHRQKSSIVGLQCIISIRCVDN